MHTWSVARRRKTKFSPANDGRRCLGRAQPVRPSDSNLGSNAGIEFETFPALATYHLRVVGELSPARSALIRWPA
jgi:hypothetical protein